MTAPKPKPWILGIHPYTPGKSASDDGRTLIKLSANENPLGSGTLAREALTSRDPDMSIYSDPGAKALRSALSVHYGIEADRIICGSGSDDILHLAAGVFASVGDEVLYVRYGFTVYPIAARRVGAVPVEADDADYATNVDSLLTAISERTRVVFIANPNNPTGTYLPRAELERLHSALRPDILLVVDQAYSEYLDVSEDDGALDLARTQPNVLVTRTFSKIHGLAGERVGWGYGSAAIIEAMNRIRLPFNVSTTGQIAALAALNDTEHVENSRAQNEKWLRWFEGEVALLGNSGLRTVPSKANFSLLLFEGAVSAETAYKALMDAGIIVRWLPNQGLEHGLRITIGMEPQMRTIVRVLRELCGVSA